MIKAIFFDLDGTLLTSDKKIPNTAMESLIHCKRKGIKLFVATARPPLLEKMLNFSPKEIGLFDGGVYCNGGCESIIGHLTYKYISQQIVKYCVDNVNEYDKLNIALQMKNEIHAFNHPLDDFAYEKWGIEKKDTLLMEKTDFSEVVKILIYYENIIDSITVIPTKLVELLQEFCNDKAKLYLTDNGKVIQIVDKKINKFESIENIRKYLNLKKSEISVFGDDVNDIEMLSNYDYSVAMGNATDEVKAIAGMVTKSNDDDGIAYGISMLLNG